MSERFTPESIEQDIDALLAAEAQGHDAGLTRALAGLYAPPAEAGAALDRVYARVRTEGDRLADSESQRGLDSRYGPDRGEGSSPAIKPPARPVSYSYLHNPHAVTEIRPALAAVAAVLVAAVITGSFLFAFQSHGRKPGVTAGLLSTSTPLPTLGPAAVPIPGVPLAWQTHAVPVPFIPQPAELGIAVSPRDGATAYICDPVLTAGGAQLSEIWVTHNRGIQWTHTGNLPVLGQALGQADQCSVDVDAFNSDRLVAMLSDWNFLDSFTSSDSGGSWQMVAQAGIGTGTNSVQIQSEALYQGKAYALYTDFQTEVPSHISVSTDGLHTWQPVDTPILSLTGSRHYVKQYWARVDADGQLDLLADVSASPRYPLGLPGVDTLWVSHDGGGHWSQLPAPPMEGFIAQVSSDGQSWLICGLSTTGLNDSHVALACSMDGGTTWAARPALRTCDSCSDSSVSADGNIYVVTGVYLTGDGSLIQEDGDQTQPGFALYRLPPHSTQWQYLGPLPADDNALLYAPSSTSGGVLWTYGGSGGGLFGSDLSGVAGGSGGSPGVLYSATYPA